MKRKKNSKPKVVTQPRDEEARNESWYLRWQQYQWSLYANGYAGLGYLGRTPWGRGISELRAYARGSQNISKYMEILDPKDEDGHNVIGISWDTLKMATNKFSIAKKRIRLVDFKPGTEGIDAILGAKRTRKKAKMKANLDPRFMQLSKAAGIGYGVKGFNSPGDVDDFAQMGLLVLKEELEAKDLLDESEEASGFEVLKDMFVDDNVETSMMSADVVIDNGQVKYKYVDPDRLVHRRSQYPDGRDIDFAGYWEEKTIAQIREESGFDEEILKKIAKVAERTSAIYGISDTLSTGREDLYKNRNNSIDDYKIKVFKSYWIAKDAESYIAGIYTPTGGKVFRKKPKNYEERPYFQGEERMFSQHNVYCSNLVVGTNYVYGYHKKSYQVRKGKKCLLPLRIWQSDKPSMIERCIPVIDQLELEWKSVQNFLAKLPPAPRLVYDEALMEEYVSLGGKDRDVFYRVEKFEKTGRFIIRSVNEHGDPNAGSNRMPVVPIELNIAQELATRMNYIASLKADLREMSGINELADGTLNQNDMLVGVAESLDMATNMILGEYVDAWKNFYKDLLDFAMKQWQVILRYNDKAVRGKNGSQTVIGKEIAEYELGIKLMPVMSEKDKKTMMQYLSLKNQEGRIDESDFFIVYEMIQAGDIKKAQFYLVKAISRRDRQIQAEKERMILLQGQQTKEAGLAVEEAKQNTEMLKQKGAERKVIMETEKGLLIERQKGKNAKELKKLELSQDS